ncbi:MAG: DUF2191 domain-containing protein [Alphaproteobacteria bacterium]|nr:DUF2191 domain-containing protein [Alphaproteobacteria bacterium]
MRTTLTIDDDVAVLLERLRRTRNLNFKALVNEALRRGLHEMTEVKKPRQPFQTRSVSLGRLRIASLDNVAEALAIAEGEGFR